MGRAVSPVTSYVAFEPGTRPSTIGLERMGLGGLGTSGFGAGGGSMGGSVRTPPDPMLLVAAAAQRCVDRLHPPTGWSVRLTMESTFDEVVDVIVDDGSSSPLVTCLTDAVWAAELTDDFDLERETFTLTFH